MGIDVEARLRSIRRNVAHKFDQGPCAGPMQDCAACTVDDLLARLVPAEDEGRDPNMDYERRDEMLAVVAKHYPAEDEGRDHALHFDPNCEECVYLARPTRETLVPAEDEGRLREAWLGGYVAAASQFTTWPEESIAAEAERRYAVLAATPEPLCEHNIPRSECRLAEHAR